MATGIDYGIQEDEADDYLIAVSRAKLRMLEMFWSLIH